MDEKTKNIIYIEDDLEMIELVTLIVKRRGYNIKGVHNGTKGFEIVKEELPDLILLDLMMPDIDGWDVFQQLKASEQTANIPIIIITAKSQVIDRVLGLHIAKADDYISKPFRPSELLDSIGKIFSQDTKPEAPSKTGS